jgi:hypothetical protein
MIRIGSNEVGMLVAIWASDPAAISPAAAIHNSA